jgi:RNA polymerase sigma-70 factor, ECF subfamily
MAPPSSPCRAVSRPPDPAAEPHRLADRLRAGDVAAFDAFIQLQWDPLVRYAAGFSGRVEDAKDIVQEALVRLWEQRSEIDSTGSVRGYVYRIVRNLALNEKNRRELHARLAAREVDRLQPSHPHPGQVLDAAELGSAVEAALRALPDRRREAFVLAHLENLSHREIAEIMGIAPQTVANQISAALGDLRRALTPLLRERDGARRARSG